MRVPLSGFGLPAIFKDSASIQIKLSFEIPYSQAFGDYLKTDYICYSMVFGVICALV